MMHVAYTATVVVDCRISTLSCHVPPWSFAFFLFSSSCQFQAEQDVESSECYFFTFDILHLVTTVTFILPYTPHGVTAIFRRFSSHVHSFGIYNKTFLQV